VKNRLILFVSAIFVCFKVSSQQKRVIITGQISSDSIALENIHIINKTSKKATISNKKGVFKIAVKENDELFISSLQFKDKLIVIKKLNINTLSISFVLSKSVNTLDEVTIKKRKSTAENLNLPNADKKPLNKIERSLNAHTKSSLPIAAIAALLNKRGGINDMIYIVSGKRRKDRKLNELRERDAFEKNQLLKSQKIRAHLKDPFFTQTLKIPSKNIDAFIMYCISKGAADKYFDGNEIEAIDMIIALSEVYLKELKNEK